MCLVLPSFPLQTKALNPIHQSMQQVINPLQRYPGSTSADSEDGVAMQRLRKSTGAGATYNFAVASTKSDEAELANILYPKMLAISTA
jgi:hypothetical protein